VPEKAALFGSFPRLSFGDVMAQWNNGLLKAHQVPIFGVPDPLTSFDWLIVQN